MAGERRPTLAEMKHGEAESLCCPRCKCADRRKRGGKWRCRACGESVVEPTSTEKANDGGEETIGGADVP